MIKRCEVCGKLFEVDGRQKKRKYCSADCSKKADKARRAEIRKKYKETKPPRPKKTGGILRKCPVCDKEFLGRYGRVYCSDDCYKTWNGIRSREYYDRKTKTCICCGQELGKHRLKFCSDDCYKKYYSQDRHIIMKDGVALQADRCECKRVERCFYATTVGGFKCCNFLEITGHARLGYPDECKYFKEK